MPGRKNSRKKLAAAHNKQLKLITSRLIEISMKVDDYIYKQKPITVANARMYIEEVCSYRIHCKQDARSLQVIDKLILQMKSIIEEQEIKHSDNIYELIQNSCRRECESSPVYSLADSNITNEIIEVSDSDTRVFKQTSKELETIDLCDNDDDNIVTVINKNGREDPNLSSVNEMQKCLSTLSLKQAEDAIDMKSNAEIINFSQSIIDVSWSLSEMTKNKMKNTDKTAIINIDTTFIDHKDKIDSAPLFTYNNNATETLNLNETNTVVGNLTGSDNPMSSRSKIANTSNDKVNLNKNKLVNKKSIRKTEPKLTTKKNTNSKKNDINKKRRPKKPTLTSTEIAKVALDNENNKPMCPLLKQTHNQSLNISKPKAAVNIPKSNTKNSISNIYNNEIVDNLSWIENIRYVREVTLDEFDPKLTYLDESFWDNYALPNNWDDRDFMFD